MAIVHLSSSGSNTAPYETWTKAATSWATAAAALAAGDTLYIDSAYSEAFGSGLSTTMPGTVASPNYVLSGTPDTGAGYGLTALVKGAAFSTTSSSGIILNGSYYAYGLVMTSSATTVAEVRLANSSAGNVVQCENCEFTVGSPGGGSGTHLFVLGSYTVSAGSLVVMRGCTFRWNSTNSQTRFSISGNVRFIGGGFASDTTTAQSSVLSLAYSNDGSHALFDGFDFQYLPNTVKFIYSTIGCIGSSLILKNCRMPSGWVPSTSTLTTAQDDSHCVELINCSDVAQNYHFFKLRPAGTSEISTAFTRVGGGSDGTTATAMKMVTTASANYSRPLYSPWFTTWNDTTGVGKTLSVELLHDSATGLTDKQCWLEAMVLTDGSGYPLASEVTSRASVLAAGSTLTSSGVTWNNSGSMSNPNKQKIVTGSFTPNVKGFIKWRICLAGPSAPYTVYVDTEGTLA